MDVVLVGLPGSGKSAVGRRLAHRHGADSSTSTSRSRQADGRRIPQIFEDDGEPAFRALEREAVAGLGPADADPAVRRVIATGGGAVIDPRNRWALYRGRLPIWLDGRPEVLAQRLRRSPTVRPLVQGRDPIGAIRELARDRARFYAAGERLNSASEVASLVERIDELAAARASGSRPARCCSGPTRSPGHLVLGEGIAAVEVAAALRGHGRDPGHPRLGARRVGGRRRGAVCGPGGRADCRSSGSCCPRARTRSGSRSSSPRPAELAALRAHRREPLVAIGGGALGDAAGFLAATWLRGVPLIHVPTTLVAQIDSSIGGKTGVDLPDGKNLVGAFHQPAAVVIDVAFLRTLPDRQRRAALGEAVKMAALGDERLFEVLEPDGEAIARGDEAAFASGVGRRGRRAGGLGEGRGRHGRRARAGLAMPGGSR